jgi:hypothetical protein
LAKISGGFLMVSFFYNLLFPNAFIRGTHYIDKIISSIAIPLIKLSYRKDTYRKKSISSSVYTAKDVIISLTSFPARINTIHLCIESLLRQSVEPTKIILWLAESQFPRKKIPNSLEKLCDRGVIIKYCDDIKSHKKYYYTMKEWPDAIVVTVDDDVFYPENMLRMLLESYKKNPYSISCFRAHEVRFDKDNSLLPYLKWNFMSPNIKGPSHLLFQIGVNGVLYPPNSLAEDVLNMDLIQQLSPSADDLWLKIMALRAGTKIVKVHKYSKTMIEIPSTQKYSLMSNNVLKGKNDLQLERLLEYFEIDLSQYMEGAKK